MTRWSWFSTFGFGDSRQLLRVGAQGQWDLLWPGSRLQCTEWHLADWAQAAGPTRLWPDEVVSNPWDHEPTPTELLSLATAHPRPTREESKGDAGANPLVDWDEFALEDVDIRAVIEHRDLQALAPAMLEAKHLQAQGLIRDFASVGLSRAGENQALYAVVAISARRDRAHVRAFNFDSNLHLQPVRF